MLKTTVLATLLALPFPVDAQESSSPGRTAYTKARCGTCHGAEGRGTAMGPSVATGDLPLPDFIAYVRRPAGTMRPYTTDVLSDADLTEIFAYLEPKSIDRAPAGRVESGAALYRRTGCYECHANEAQGGAQGPRLGPEPVPFATFTWYVRNPTGSMPPYTETVLSYEDLADIYAFLLARPTPPPVDSIPLLAPRR